MTDWVQQFKPHCALCKTLFIFKGIFNKENRYSKTTWIHVYALHIAFQTLQLQSKQRSFHLNPKTVTEWNKRTKLTLPLSVQRCHLVDKELYFSTPTFFSSGTEWKFIFIFSVVIPFSNLRRWPKCTVDASCQCITTVKNWVFKYLFCFAADLFCLHGCVVLETRTWTNGLKKNVSKEEIWK